MSLIPTNVASRIEIVPDNPIRLLDLREVYGRPAALEVDLGCGEGSFLAAVAAEHPERDFLGIERQVRRVRSVRHKIASLGLANARVLHFEISAAVCQLLPAESVSVFHLMFPDPWPKRRHAARRLVTKEFLTALHRALIPSGLFQITTDYIDYFNQIRRLASESGHFTANPAANSRAPASKFEKMFIGAGAPIHRLSLRKTSPVT